MTDNLVWSHKRRAINSRRSNRYRFHPVTETLEDRLLLACDGLVSTYNDDFDDHVLASNPNGVGAGWTSATFGGGGAEIDSAFRFDGRGLADWNLFEVSSIDTFPIWTDDSTSFEFLTGNVSITTDSLTPTRCGSEASHLAFTTCWILSVTYRSRETPMETAASTRMISILLV